MKRKMVYVGVPWTAGMFFASVFSKDMQIPAMLTVLLVSAFFFWKAFRKFVYFGVSALFFAAGMVTFTLHDCFVCDSIRAFAGTQIHFEGRITDKSERADGKTDLRVYGKINSGPKTYIICTVNDPGCTYSDKVSFDCTPSGFENTFLFKSRDYYESQGIFLKADSVKKLKVTPRKVPSPVRIIRNYSDHITGKIRSVMPGEYGALITAMLSGDKSGLDENTKKELYRCGTGHMLAVSGMHLVLIVNIVSSFLERTKLTLKKRFLVTESFIIIFTVFTGMPVSVLRAAFMMTLITAAGLFGRKADPLNSLSIAVFIMLAAHPCLIKSSSFLLSVSGTFGASVLVPYVTENMSDEGIFAGIRRNAVSVFCISVCVFPFSVMFFDEASLVSPVSDLVIIPLCTFSLLCGFGVALTGGIDVLAYPLMMAGGLAAKLVLFISSFLADTGLSSVSLGRGFVPVLTLFLTAFVVFTSLRYSNGKSTLAAMALSAAVFMASSFLSVYMNRNILSVYRVGTTRSAAVVVSMGTCTDVIDLTGKQSTSRYVSKLADICGVHHIESVSFMKDPYQSMASFSKRLLLNDVEHVYVPEGVYAGYGTDICGCVPEYYDADGLFLDRGKYIIHASCDGKVTVEYGGHEIKAEVSGVDTGEGYFTEQNIAVRKSDSGKVKVFRLG